MISVTFRVAHTINGVDYAAGQTVSLPVDVARGVILSFVAQFASRPLPPLSGGGDPLAGIATTTYGRALLALTNQPALMGLLAAATTTAPGVVPLATSAEATTGTDTSKAVTPAALRAALTTALDGLVAGAPGLLDTLGEIAAALQADEAAEAALVTVVAAKLAKAANLSDVASPATALANLGGVPATRTVAGQPLSGNVTLTKSDVGLGNVDNTSDASKPVSTATTTAIANALASAVQRINHTGVDPITALDKTVPGYIRKNAAGFWPTSWAADGTPSYVGGSSTTGVRRTSETDRMFIWQGTEPFPPFVTSGNGGVMDGVDAKEVL